MKKIFALASALLLVLTVNAAGFPAQPDFGELNWNTAVRPAARAPQAQQAVPTSLSLYNQTYNSAAFRWKYYGWSAAGFACVLWTADGKQVAYITWTIEAFEYIMYLDNIPYELSGDTPIDYYVSTYWILNAPDGMTRGADWTSYTYQISNGSNSLYALTEGKYRLDVYELTESGLGGGPVSIEFTLTDPKAKNLKAEVAADNKTATLTWDQPALKSGERLYVSVLSGSETAFDNYSGTPVATSPLVVEVKEGRTYSASVQAVDQNNKAVGSQALIYFTVGTNSYLPKNLNASVADYNHVTFTWTAAAPADYYRIEVYNEYGDLTYSVNNTASPVYAQLEAGTYTWTLTPYEKAQDGLYYPLTNAVQGNTFTTTAAPLAEDVVVLNAWYMDAAYAPYDDRNIFDENDPGIKEGKYFWLVRLFTGENESNFPQFWIYIYTEKNWAISGQYRANLGNLYDGGMFKTEVAGAPTAGSNIDLKLVFQGFDFDMAQLGAYDGIYSGYCDITVSGTKYRININNLTAIACNLDYFIVEGEDTPVYFDMIDEDPNNIEPYTPGSSEQALESIRLEENTGTRKVLLHGQLYIIRENAIYNVSGLRVK